MLIGPSPPKAVSSAYTTITVHCLPPYFSLSPLLPPPPPSPSPPRPSAPLSPTLNHSHRKRIEKLLGDDQNGAIGDVREGLVPLRGDMPPSAARHQHCI